MWETCKRCKIRVRHCHGDCADIKEEAEKALKELAPDLNADECSMGVFAARLIKDGQSYDSKSGIWWREGSKPGILEEKDKRIAELEADIKKKDQSIGEAEAMLNLQRYALRKAGILPEEGEVEEHKCLIDCKTCKSLGALDENPDCKTCVRVCKNRGLKGTICKPLIGSEFKKEDEKSEDLIILQIEGHLPIPDSSPAITVDKDDPLDKVWNNPEDDEWDKLGKKITTKEAYDIAVRIREEYDLRWKEYTEKEVEFQSRIENQRNSLEVLQDQIVKAKRELTTNKEIVAEQMEEIARLKDRLQISTMGDDKIDELEEVIRIKNDKITELETRLKLKKLEAKVVK